MSIDVFTLASCNKNSIHAKYSCYCSTYYFRHNYLIFTFKKSILLMKYKIDIEKKNKKNFQFFFTINRFFLGYFQVHSNFQLNLSTF